MPEPVYIWEDVALLEGARRWRPEITMEGLDAGVLQSLAESDGMELATGVLYDRVCKSSRHGAMIRAIHACRRESCVDRSPVLCVVPGLLWKQNEHTGANGAMVTRVAEELGVKAVRLDLTGVESVKTNGQRILEWLRQNRERPVVLISLSKGSSDVLAAFYASQEAGTQMGDFAHVRSWLSLSGTLQGNQLVQWVCDRPLRTLGVKLLLRLRGYKFDHIREFGRRAGPTQPAWPRFPSHMRVMHVVAVPLKRHLTHRWADKGYERLRDCGPNDGCGVLLGDAAGWPGEVFPVWGSDHYLQPAWDIHPLIRSLVLAGLDGLATIG